MSNELKRLFENVADSIREKTGSTDTMKPQEFPEKIAEIEALPVISVEENGTYKFFRAVDGEWVEEPIIDVSQQGA